MKYQLSEDWGGREIKHGVYRWRWRAALEALWASSFYGNQWYITEVANDIVGPTRKEKAPLSVIHRSK